MQTVCMTELNTVYYELEERYVKYLRFLCRIAKDKTIRKSQAVNAIPSGMLICGNPDEILIRLIGQQKINVSNGRFWFSENREQIAR